MSAYDHMATIGRLAAPQDGVVARSQLLSADIASSTIGRMRNRDVLIDVFPGVYLVGVPSLSHRAFLRACLLLVGKVGSTVAVSRRSGLEQRKVLPVKTGFAALTTTRHNVDETHRTLLPLASGGDGLLTVHESTTPLAFEFVDGLATTLLPRTFAEFAETCGVRDLKRAWREATFLSLLDPAALDHELDMHRRPGNDAIRERLANAYPVTRPGIELRSREGELAFLELVRELGLPEPQVNVRLTVGDATYVADFYWADIGLIVETDGRQHELEEHRAQDQVRHLDLFAHGLDAIHIANKRLTTHRAWCGDRLLEAYRRQAARAATGLQALDRITDAGLRPMVGHKPASVIRCMGGRDWVARRGAAAASALWG